MPIDAQQANFFTAGVPRLLGASPVLVPTERHAWIGRDLGSNPAAEGGLLRWPAVSLSRWEPGVCTLDPISYFVTLF